MELTTKLDDREFQRKLRQLSALRGRPLEQFTRQSARRFAVSLAKGTVPVGLGAKAKKQGDATVRNDIYSVFMPEGKVYKQLDEDQSRQYAWLLNNSTPAQITAFLRSVGVNAQYRRTATASLHQQRRNTKGRVPRNDSPPYIAPGEKIQNLIRRVQRRVLMAKNGWAMCARQLGGTRGLDRAITTKKRAQPTGRVTERRTANGITYRLHNLVTHVSHLITRQTIATSWKIENNVLRREIGRAIKSRSR